MEASKMKGHRKSIQGFFPSSSSDHSTNSCHNLTSANKCLSKKTRCNRREYQNSFSGKYDKAGGLQTLFFMAGWGRELGGGCQQCQGLFPHLSLLSLLNHYQIYHCSIITKGSGGTPLYRLYRYVRRQRVWFQPFGLKQGTNFDHFGLKQGMVCARQS